MKTTETNPARMLLEGSETVDIIPPYRCLPPPNKEWLEEKVKRIGKVIAAKDAEIEKLKKELARIRRVAEVLRDSDEETTSSMDYNIAGKIMLQVLDGCDFS